MSFYSSILACLTSTLHLTSLQVVAKIQQEYEALVAEDKGLERLFRQRKDLLEYEQYIDALFKLYKRRPKKATGPTDAALQ